MSALSRYRRIRRRAHPDCRLCGAQPAILPSLRFHPAGVGGVVADWACEAACAGYSGLLHGGIAAAVCDAAMTNALFARDVVARTARLDLRYRRPLRLGRTARVSARSESPRAGAWRVRAEIHQAGELAVSAEALFLAPPDDPGHDDDEPAGRPQ